jgi:YidC/Oxa1 family membrane protein insertase
MNYFRQSIRRYEKNKNRHPRLTVGLIIPYFLSIVVKIVTLPLTTSQLESTTKMQKLTPLQKRIQERYVDDEPTKNKMLSQLFQAANVNPLAGCAPALIQIPIFISLYRALQNLIAENKLDEPFLWIPGTSFNLLSFHIY